MMMGFDIFFIYLPSLNSAHLLIPGIISEIQRVTHYCNSQNVLRIFHDYMNSEDILAEKIIQ